MMTEWYECKIRYAKVADDGTQKNVTETYLVDALSFTEAEKRFLDEVTDHVTGEYVVTGIKKMKLAELFESADTTDDRWYKARVALITLDEKSGQEKRSVCNILVQASDLRRAVSAIDKGMGTGMQDYVIVSVAETPIMDIYHYVPSDSE